MKAKYNDVPGWDYGTMFQAFSPHVQTKAFKMTTGKELDKLLDDPSFRSAKHPQVCTGQIRDSIFLIVYLDSAGRRFDRACSYFWRDAPS